MIAITQITMALETGDLPDRSKRQVFGLVVESSPYGVGIKCVNPASLGIQGKPSSCGSRVKRSDPRDNGMIVSGDPLF